jgi:hypothetical protein
LAEDEASEYRLQGTAKDDAGQAKEEERVMGKQGDLLATLDPDAQLERALAIEVTFMLIAHIPSFDSREDLKQKAKELGARIAASARKKFSKKDT